MARKGDLITQGGGVLNTLVKARKSIRQKIRALRNEEFAMTEAVTKSLQPVIEPLHQVAKIQTEELGTLKKIEKEFEGFAPPAPKAKVKEEPREIIYPVRYKTPSPRKQKPVLGSKRKPPKEPLKQRSPYQTRSRGLKRLTFSPVKKRQKIELSEQVQENLAKYVLTKTPTPDIGPHFEPEVETPEPSTSRQTYGLRSKSGKGLVKCGGKNIRIRLPQNLNKLVNRLKLLYASKKAGHTGHLKEIQAILRKLKRLKVIQ